MLIILKITIKNVCLNDPIIIQIKLNMFVSYVDHSKNNNKKYFVE